MTNSKKDDASSASENPLERIKQTDPDGNEFWSGRDLTSVLGYASWQKMSAIYREIYSSFCLENPLQIEILPTLAEVQIGSGAIRQVENWKISALAMERILSRIAGYKPEAVRVLRERSNARWRIETDLGAALFDFCEQAGLSIIHQKALGNYRFDYCIDDRLLIEIDEPHHQLNPRVQMADNLKTAFAASSGYTLLRITIPVDNLAKLCGNIARAINSLQPKSDWLRQQNAARSRPVIAEDFAIFFNHGYRGLHNAPVSEVKESKMTFNSVQPAFEDMSNSEFAIYAFFITQIEDKLRRENIQGKEEANQVHYQAGVVVRRAIAELGGTMPEDLPTVESIKKLERAEKKRLAAPKNPQEQGTAE